MCHTLSNNGCHLYIIFVGAGFGEPHIYTLDGQLYTFNPVGEYWMIKSELLSMQSRMVQWINPTTSEAVQATQFQAFAMRSNVSGTLSDEIHIELNNNRSGNNFIHDFMVLWFCLKPYVINIFFKQERTFLTLCYDWCMKTTAIEYLMALIRTGESLKCLALS